MLRKFVIYFSFFLLFFHVQQVFSQQIVRIDANTKEHIFVNKEVVCLEDASGKLTINEVKSSAFTNKFVENVNFYPKN